MIERSLNTINFNETAVLLDPGFMGEGIGWIPRRLQSNWRQFDW